MTLTLAGDVAISFVLTIVADALGRRIILAVGAALMSASGIVFFFFGNYWILLAGAVLGVISPSGNEIGPFRLKSLWSPISLPRTTEATSTHGTAC